MRGRLGTLRLAGWWAGERAGGRSRAVGDKYSTAAGGRARRGNAAVHSGGSSGGSGDCPVPFPLCSTQPFVSTSSILKENLIQHQRRLCARCKARTLTSRMPGFASSWRRVAVLSRSTSPFHSARTVVSRAGRRARSGRRVDRKQSDRWVVHDTIMFQSDLLAPMATLVSAVAKWPPGGRQLEAQKASSSVRHMHWA